MFGYVRPVREELKCRDFDLYRAAYCGLCRTMRMRYGWIAPMFLNYDFTFLALLLAPPEQSPCYCKGRCHANPLRKKQMLAPQPALELAADESVILTWWKLKDQTRDTRGIKKSVPWMLGLLLYPAYRKAARSCASFDQVVQEKLTELCQLEQEGCTSMDRCADTFAQLLCGAAPKTGESSRDRAFEQLLYHLGRWIYLVDAQDDLEEDKAKGTFNPILARFGSEGAEESLKCTLDHSLNLMYSAAQLMEFGCRWPVIENILYFGMPLVQKAVFDQSWKQIQKQKIWRNHT